VNDTRGLAAGDAVLLEVSEYIKGLIRVTDIYGRYEGEEYIIFMPHTKLDEAVMLAARIRESLRLNQFGRLKVMMSMGGGSD
jgi:polar amino acid transport system substrate-binding protein